MKLVGGPRDGAIISDPGGPRIKVLRVSIPGAKTDKDAPTLVSEYAPSPDRSYAIFLYENVMGPT